MLSVDRSCKADGVNDFARRDDDELRPFDLNVVAAISVLDEFRVKVLG
jgi:hypothetical protein